MKNKIFKTIVKISLISLVLAMSFHVLPVKAAGTLTNVSDAISPPTASASADHTIVFTLETALHGSNNTKIQIFFPAGFDASALNGDSDVAISGSTHGPMVVSSNCMNPGTQIAAVTGGATWIPFELCNGMGAAFDAGETVTMLLGENAGGVGQIVNPPAGDSLIITIETTYKPGIPIIFLDIGHTAVSIIDNAQAEITATIDPSLTFDIDTTTVAMPGAETPPPYSVALGDLSASAITTSNNSTINSIYLDFQTNATSGGTVTVEDANAGLTSVAASKTIASNSGLLSIGNEGYGICYSSISNLDTPYPTYHTGNCTPTKHTVGALQTTPQDFIGTSIPNTPGRVEVLVKASISNITPAAPDYSDTITFIATGNF